MSERDKIVAFLRREAEEFAHTWDKALIRSVAVRIERGDHLVKPKPTIPFAEWCDKPNVGH